MRKYFSMIISIFIMIIIFRFSSENGTESLKHSDSVSRFIKEFISVKMFFRFRKLAHFVIYFFLATFSHFNFLITVGKVEIK